MMIKIGVMGSAGGEMPEPVKKLCYELGRQIAMAGCILLTGGCPGLPQESTRGAKDTGGITIGISPGLNLSEHVDLYKSPTEDLDVLIFTGSGLMGREVIGVRSCDIIVIVGGRSGTLGEFAIAYDEGKPIGVLLGTGGIAEEIAGIVEKIQKPTGSQVFYDTDPARLVKSVVEHFKSQPVTAPRYEAAG